MLDDVKPVHIGEAWMAAMNDDIEHIQEQDEAYDDTSNEDLEEPFDSDDREMSHQPGSAPDVLLDVPELRVDEIILDVEDLRAHVSLQAEVLELLKLSVGADVQLGRVHLEIKGVTVGALLKVRLDNVAAIVGRVLTTIDRNPQILEQVTSAVGGVARDLGRGAGESVAELGRGAGESVGELGRGAGSAVGEVGRQAGEAVGTVGESAGAIAEEGVGGAVKDVGGAVKDVGDVAGDVAGETAESSEQTADTARCTANKAQGRTDTGGRRDRDELEEASHERGSPRRPTERRAQDGRREARPP